MNGRHEVRVPRNAEGPLLSAAAAQLGVPATRCIQFGSPLLVRGADGPAWLVTLDVVEQREPEPVD